MNWNEVSAVCFLTFSSHCKAIWFPVCLSHHSFPPSSSVANHSQWEPFTTLSGPIHADGVHCMWNRKWQPLGGWPDIEGHCVDFLRHLPNPGSVPVENTYTLDCFFIWPRGSCISESGLWLGWGVSLDFILMTLFIFIKARTHLLDAFHKMLIELLMNWFLMIKVSTLCLQNLWSVLISYFSCVLNQR